MTRDGGQSTQLVIARAGVMGTHPWFPRAMVLQNHVFLLRLKSKGRKRNVPSPNRERNLRSASLHVSAADDGVDRIHAILGACLADGEREVSA